MGIFDFFKGSDINREVEAYREEADAVLLDVRTPQEFWAGHIPGSSNLPLDCIEGAELVIGEKDRPVYVYCHSGSRSRQAAALLKQLGFTRVKNIGGIAAWKGEVERG